ncbi:hypothetical protein ATANTOWER_018629 [Ataeniobius toweri]|uniref:Uncharacterized protein n=1 Tax=Ataeniobius toweri TaxID=208326 RepID=A0ABU7AQ83_9TELE|nr:hypothetical protein [Ataeniobius toweri]
MLVSRNLYVFSEWLHLSVSSHVSVMSFFKIISAVSTSFLCPLDPFSQLSFSEAMRNKARLSITGSVGENGRVLTPDCPKAVHAGHASLRHPGLAVVSSGLP